MRKSELEAIREAGENGRPISEELALWVLGAAAGELPGIFAAASAARRLRFGDAVRLCSIVNARSGACGEDCAFCAQASCHETGVAPKPLFSEEELTGAYETAAALPITHFGVVTSGGALPPGGVERICGAIRSKRLPGVNWCASLGCLNRGALSTLREAGLKRFHHNLETARSFFPEICSTHTYDERLATVRNAREAGLETCCGGIMGLGESLGQRVEFAMILAEEAVDSIPLNFLIPIPGTRLEQLKPMKPLDILRTTAMFRLTNPRAEVRVCAGRMHLRDLQSMIFHAGANGMMIGDLLTVAARGVEEDLRMLGDLEVDHAR